MLKAIFVVAVACGAHTVYAAPFPGCVGGTLAGCPGTPNCTVETVSTVCLSVVADTERQVCFPDHSPFLTCMTNTHNHPTVAIQITQNIDHFNWAPPLGNAKKTTFNQR